MRKKILEWGVGEKRENAPYLLYPALWLLSVFTRLLYCTLRIKVSAESAEKFSRSGATVMMIWHNRISMTPYIKTVLRCEAPIYGLVSPSKDGAILERYFKFFGIRAVRGSSNKNGAKAIVSLIRELRNGNDICITPDGPKGPKYEMKAGAMLVCSKSEAKILFMRVKFGKCWAFSKTWDNFTIPKPFSTVVLEADQFESYSELERHADANAMSVEDFSRMMLNGAC